MGNESMCIVQNVFANKWFKGKELAFALALGMSVGRLGSTTNNLLNPIIAEGTSLPIALFFGLGLILMSYTLGLVLLSFENKAKRDEQRYEIDEPQVVVSEQVDFSYVKDFPLSFWIITINCVCIYAALFPFNNISNDFFMTKYDFSLRVASRVTSTVFIIAAFSCSAFGIISDKVGYRVTFVICASSLLFLAHFLFLSMPSCHQCYEGLLPMVCIGISYSIYSAALWPMIPIVIKEEYLGTAFGITLAIQNAGLGFGPNIVGVLQSFDSSYNAVIIFFMTVSGIGIISGIVLYFVSKKSLQNILQLPTREVQELRSQESS